MRKSRAERHLTSFDREMGTYQRSISNKCMTIFFPALQLFPSWGCIKQLLVFLETSYPERTRTSNLEMVVRVVFSHVRWKPENKRWKESTVISIDYRGCDCTLRTQSAAMPATHALRNIIYHHIHMNTNNLFTIELFSQNTYISDTLLQVKALYSKYYFNHEIIVAYVLICSSL